MELEKDHRDHGVQHIPGPIELAKDPGSCCFRDQVAGDHQASDPDDQGYDHDLKRSCEKAFDPRKGGVLDPSSAR